MYKKLLTIAVTMSIIAFIPNAAAAPSWIRDNLVIHWAEGNITWAELNRSLKYLEVHHVISMPLKIGNFQVHSLGYWVDGNPCAISATPSTQCDEQAIVNALRNTSPITPTQVVMPPTTTIEPEVEEPFMPSYTGFAGSWSDYWREESVKYIIQEHTAQPRYLAAIQDAIERWEAAINAEFERVAVGDLGAELIISKCDSSCREDEDGYQMPPYLWEDYDGTLSWGDEMSKVYFRVSDADGCYTHQYLSDNIAHEIGHHFGIEHSIRASDLMYGERDLTDEYFYVDAKILGITPPHAYITPPYYIEDINMYKQHNCGLY